MVQPPKDLREFSSLTSIVESLRGPNGCPWDKEQTHRSLTPFAIEEAFELAEAIEQGDVSETVLELGDLLLQVVLHAEIARQEKQFDIHDVIAAISEKMVRRHPHVFGDEQVADAEHVLVNWDKIKALEKAKAPKATSAENKFDIPTALPALTRSQKIGVKTQRLRFDWPDADAVLDKVDEELQEVKDEMPARDPKKLEHEIGDLLFSVAQLARHVGLEAEQCLRSANARFEQRFFTMRQLIKDEGRDYDKLSAPELEEAWQKTKKKLEAR